MSDEGASPNERLLAAAKTDNEELMNLSLGISSEEGVEGGKIADVNYQDSLGNTALHYAISRASTSVLEILLCHEQCDVDIQNKLARETPLHLAVKVDEEGREGLRAYLVQSLVEAGANPFLKNTYNERPIDLLPPPPPPTRPGAAAPSRSEEEQAASDATEQIRSLLRQAEAEHMMGAGGDGDVADEDDLIDEDDVASD